jgi:SulP family sulfate permease
VLIAAPLASYVPLATLSAIVMVVAVNMGEWHEFLELRRYSYNYRIILLATFFVTVVFDLTIAVELGMVLASLFFIYRMSELTRIERLPLLKKPRTAAFIPRWHHARRRLATLRLTVLWRGEQAGGVARPAAPGIQKWSFSTWRKLIQLDTTGL